MSVVASILLTFVFSLSCNTMEPQPTPTGLLLQALDASCTEAWLRVTLPSEASPRTVSLVRDGDTVLTMVPATDDTTLIDDGLSPNTTYSYQAIQWLTSTMTEKSEMVRLSTLDTTSRDFVFELDTLGDGAGSVLYDVALINDTLAYAVGEISVLDSTGQWQFPPYNVAKWNGRTWELMTILYNYQGPDTFPAG